MDENLFRINFRFGELHKNLLLQLILIKNNNHLLITHTIDHNCLTNSSYLIIVFINDKNLFDIILLIFSYIYLINLIKFKIVEHLEKESKELNIFRIYISQFYSF